MSLDMDVGIIGGAGQLGAALARGFVAGGAVAAARLHVSCRSGVAPALADLEGITIHADNAALAARCGLIVLCVPPAAAGAIGITAPDALVVSVMAGVRMERIAALTGSRRVARAMSSPAAGRCMAWSPWCAGPGIGAEERGALQALFAATGDAAEVPDEDQIDRFTAMTGPVPGFVAAFAAAMIAHAESRGIAPPIAERAIRQLFRGAAAELADGPSPEAQVQAMIDYAGTTAAGLVAMRAEPLQQAVDAGLEAAYLRCKTMG